MQQGMVFEAITSGQPGTNLQQIVCRLDHPIDHVRLAQAWDAVQERHPALRSHIEWQGHTAPRQVVNDTAPLPLQVEDWAGIDDETAESRLTAWLARDRQAGVEIDRGPAQRLALFVRSEAQAILVWTFPHALLDGRSFTRVLEEVFDRYDGATVTAAPPPGEATVADHAQAVAARNADADTAEADRVYFAELLDGVGGPTELPIARPATTRTAEPHRMVEHRLPAAVVEELETLARDTETTLYTTLLAAWALLLARYSGTTDVVFGSTRSGRHAVADAGATVGCLINTVPTRVACSPETTVGGLLAAIRFDQVAVRPHEQAPLTVSTSPVPCEPGHPLLSTNVVFEQYLMDTRLQARGGPWADRRFTVVEEGGFPLSLAAYLDGDGDGGLRLVVEFDPGHYPDELVVALLGHLGHLLEQLAAVDREATIGSFELVTADERLRLLRHPHYDPTPAGVHPDRFEAAVAAHPDRPAVLTVAADGGAGAGITYAQLDRRANQLAHALLDRGIGHGDRVAVLLPRGVSYAVAVLGIHKAEAAFVPLDGSYPPEALAHMVSDSGARLILTDGPRSMDGLDAPTIGLDDLDLDRWPTEAPDRPKMTADTPAYVIYTSGSTGVPKGVVIGQGQMAGHSLAFRRDMVDLSPEDRILHFASLSFDISIEELFPTWTAGACVVARNDAMAQSLDAFLTAVDDHRLTILNLPTAFWHELVRHTEHRGHRLPDRVRTVVIGGEKASASAYRAWRASHPHVGFVNSYGPTECSVSATVFDPDEAGPSVLTDEAPIGRPLSNVLAYVVDGAGRPVPVGVPGELWLGGRCVGLGYHGAPERTAERFTPDPFAHRAHGPADAVDDVDADRIYRTGDLVRWLPSGQLEFLGRIDRQIKVRGFRIEPGHIEAAAEAHPGVDRAVVAARPSGGSDQLCAWLVAEPGRRVDAAEIREALALSLPAHLVPTAIAVVDELPVTAGGKIDMGALPDPTPTVAAEADDERAPDDDLDHQVLAVFARVLGLDDAPFTGSFFDLGGHSLLSIRLLDELEAATGARLTLPVLHRAPSAAAVADLIRSGELADPDAAPNRYLLTIQDGADGERAVLVGVHVLGVNNAYFRPLAERLGPDQTVLGLTLGRIGGTDLRHVDDIADAYAEELLRAAPDGPLVLAAVSLGSVVTFELARRLRNAGREVKLVALLDARGPHGDPTPTMARRLRLHAAHLLRDRSRYLRPRLAKAGVEVRRRLGGLGVQVLARLGRPIPESVRMEQADARHLREQEAHELTPYDGDVVLFRAAGEVFDDPAWRDGGMGWSDLLPGVFHLRDVPGEHLSILAEPNVETLADQLDPFLRPPRPSTDES